MAKKKDGDSIFSKIASELDGDVLADTDPVRYFVDTGNLAFNWVLSGKFMGGGIPGRKITEMFGPEASGKCIAENMEVLLSNGKLKTIKEIVETKDSTPIVSLNENTKKFEAMQVDQFWDNGKKECWEVKTRTGRSIITTKNHYYLTPNGWKYLRNIKKGSFIAVPKIMSFFGTAIMNNDELKFLAYMLAEGCCVASFNKGKKHGYVSNFTNADNLLVKDFEKCCDNLGVSFYRKKLTNFLSGNAKSILRKYKILGHSARTKTIPEELFSCPKEQIAEFLKIFFSCDGYIEKESNAIGLTLANKKLIEQISHLLMRFGIVHTCKYHLAKCKGKEFDAWRISIDGKEYQDIFIKEINFLSVKRKCRSKVKIGMSFIDKFPHEIANDFCDDLREELVDIPIPKVTGVGKFPRPDYNLRLALGGSRLQNINTQIRKKIPVMRISFSSIDSSSTTYKKYMESDILWDEVISVKCVGNQQTYDLGVKQHHNFVANNCIVHNSYWGANVSRGCQVINGIPVYLDCENSLNNDFVVKTSHIDLNKIVRFDPSKGIDSLEGVFNKVHAVIRAVRAMKDDRPLVFIYDSIAASPCARELRETQVDIDKCSDAEWKSVVGGKAQPGERARICSSELRKMGAILEKADATLLVLNQTRMKIGVKYGCHFYCSKVLLEDGSWMKIGKIVNNKLPVKVMSCNIKTGVVEPKQVVGWHKNGKVEGNECFIKIKFRRRFNNAFGSMMVTPNHRIFKKDDFGRVIEVNAGDIKVGDTLAAVQPYYLSDEQMQFVYGSILGDGCLERKAVGQNAHLDLGHGFKQVDYLNFKTAAFDGLHGVHYVRQSDNAEYVTTTSLYELERLCNYKNKVGKIRFYNIPQEIIDNLDELGLAIWYMDNGTYSGYHDKYGNGKCNICCTKFKDKSRMLSVFSNRFGLNPKIENVGFVFNSEDTCKLHNLICRFVPPCMNYKIHPRFHGLFDYEHKGNNFRYEIIPNEVLEVKKLNHRNQPYKYDLTIKDNETYVVGGAIVHNSPETTAGGGESLKFYASCRVRTSIQKKIENKKLKTSIGINLKVTNKKNRCCPPFREAQGVHLYWNDGVNPLSGLLTCLIQAERIEATGKGMYIVKEPWASGQEIKFKASKARNDMSSEVLLKCPSLVDAKNEQDLKDYLDIFNVAIQQSLNEDNEEKDATQEESNEDDYADE